MGKHTNYKFPSTLDIEKPLRRKFRTRNCSRAYDWAVVIVFLLLLTALYLLVSRVVDDQAHAAEVSRESTYSTLCAQYQADSSLVGTAAEATLKDICN